MICQLVGWLGGRFPLFVERVAGSNQPTQIAAFPRGWASQFPISSISSGGVLHIRLALHRRHDTFRFTL